MAFLWRKKTLKVKKKNNRFVFSAVVLTERLEFLYISCSRSWEIHVQRHPKHPPFAFRIKNERELTEKQARQEVLLAKRHRELKHGGHALVLHHTGKR